ncbi:MAG: hypothetical protein HQL37_08450 [Alphaproteobacteria bacterium]|nr:hypothetical protein [Alphaproteobacteria bacterium]
MPKHIARFLGLLILVIVGAVGLRYLFVAHSYYKYGSYRADSVTEISALPVQVAPSSYYQSFYPDIFATWTGGVHKAVQCVVCHGPLKVGATPKLDKPQNITELCTTCHAAFPGRPKSQPQVVVLKHAGRQVCLNCHNPHSPLLTSEGKSIVEDESEAAPGSDDFNMADASAVAAAPAKKKAPVGNVVAGQKKSLLCLTCHGLGNVIRGNNAGPNLGAQTAEHIALELRKFQSGKRPSVVMGPVANGLSSDEINDLAAYFATSATNKR